MSETEFLQAWGDAYTESCRKAIVDYLQRSTRFGGSDAQFGSMQPALRHLRLKVQHKLDVRSETQDVLGRAQPGSADASFGDAELYNQAIAEQVREETRRTETATGLINAVQQTVFAAIAKPTRLRTHPRGLFHTRKCFHCDGKGDLQCPVCKGTRTVMCGVCRGWGWYACSLCKNGTISELKFDGQPGQPVSRWESRPCNSCNRGQITCSCRGGYIDCGNCRATGRVQCGECQGAGCFTRITRTSTYTTPSFSASYPEGTPVYVMGAVEKKPLADLGQVGRIELSQHNLLRNDLVDFTYDGSISFCEASLTILSHDSRWIVFGTPARVFDAGGSLETLLQADADALGALNSGSARRLPTFPARAAAAIRPFMMSEINQQMADADGSGATAAQIVSKLDGAVTEQYVTESLLRLKRVTRTALTWRFLNWSAVAVALSIAASLLMIAKYRQPLTYNAFTARYTGIDQALNSGFIGAPIGLALALLAEWTNHIWLRKTGGKPLERWALVRKPALRWLVVAGFMVLGVLPVAAIQRQWPIAIGSPRSLNARATFAPQESLLPSVRPIARARQERMQIDSGLGPPILATNADSSGATASVALPPSVVSASAVSLDGHWYSPANNYSMLIRGSRGITTLSNSQNYHVGDIALRIDTAYRDSIRGSAVFTDGASYETIGQRLGPDTLVLYAPRMGHRWGLVRAPLPASFSAKDESAFAQAAVLAGGTGPVEPFNGSWYSPVYRYAIRIRGMRGIATIANASTYKAGDITLRIDNVTGNGFSGSSIFTDGGFYPVTGRLVNSDTIEMASPRGNSRWILVRRGE
jgi:hypothetical protein